VVPALPKTIRFADRSRLPRGGKGLLGKFPKYVLWEEPGGYNLVTVSKFRMVVTR
jgi:hypothetical protein